MDDYVALLIEHGQCNFIYQLKLLARLDESGVTQFALYRMHTTGDRAAQDPPKAEHYLRRAVAAGFPPALNAYGEQLEMEGKLERALSYYRKAAGEAPNGQPPSPRAMWHLGTAYRTGRGVEPDPAQALRWLEKAAQYGDAAAQCDLGVMLERQQGDLQRAVFWYEKAAGQGHPDGELLARACREKLKSRQT